MPVAANIIGGSPRQVAFLHIFSSFQLNNDLLVI